MYCRSTYTRLHIHHHKAKRCPKGRLQQSIQNKQSHTLIEHKFYTSPWRALPPPSVAHQWRSCGGIYGMPRARNTLSSVGSCSDAVDWYACVPPPPVRHMISHWPGYRLVSNNA